MQGPSMAAADSPVGRRGGAAVQQYARVIGVLILVSIVAGGFGEGYVPARIIVPGDAGATAGNVANLHLLFRLGFAAYLVEAVCDVALAVAFYVLLKPAGRHLALLTAFLGVLSTALYAVAEAFYFAPTIILSGAGYLDTFSPEQLNALVLLSLTFFGRVAGIFLIVYGLAMVIRGYLIFRSGFLPKGIGALVSIGGFGFAAQSLAVVLAPARASQLLLAPMAVAGVSLMLWLLLRGVNVPVWQARAAAA